VADGKKCGLAGRTGRLRFELFRTSRQSERRQRPGDEPIEQQVNEEILLNNELETNLMGQLSGARIAGAIAFFGDRVSGKWQRLRVFPDSDGHFSAGLFLQQGSSCAGAARTSVKRSGAHRQYYLQIIR